jgi:hypothetical protein
MLMKGKFKGNKNPFYGKHHSVLVCENLSKLKKDLYKDINNHPRFKNKSVQLKSGYILIYKPDHPYGKNCYVYEHRLVMEKHLGRYLTKDEVVHHINEIKNDNRLKNLMLLTNSKHSKLHHEKSKNK